jgi:hypothetical protein
MTGKANLYDYDHFRELGRIARIAKVEKAMAPRQVDGCPTTRTQRAFWVLGWEAEDDFQQSQLVKEGK